MDRDIYTDDFEDFLKQKTEQYKLYPSEKSWKKIYYSLHSTKRWITIGSSLLIIITGLFFLDQGLSVDNPIKAFLPNKPSDRLTKNIKTAEPENMVAANNKVPSTASANFPLVQEKLVDNRVYGSAARSSQGLFAIRGGEFPTALQLPELAVSPEVEASTSSVNPGVEEAGVDGKNLVASPITITQEKGEKKINWLQEQALIRLSKPAVKRLNLQLYFSPSVSYRKLADNKTVPSAGQNGNAPVSTTSMNIDNYVQHNPSIGAELGTNILYSASKNLTLKTGVQLNYSRYTIKAFRSYFEKTSIALNSVGPIADTITSMTSIRNFSGYSGEQLQNQYFQLSVPVGAEWKVIGNKKIQFNVAGTIQPTYLLFNDAYLLSSDYMNYTKEPSLIRKWNVHTSVEAFLSYKMGGVRWQVGPQFRYQLMSSYVDRYPIKEYLMEYGIKIGVSKTLK